MWSVGQRVVIRILSDRPATVVLLLAISGVGWLCSGGLSAWMRCFCLFFPLALYFLLSSPLGLLWAERGLTCWLAEDTGERVDAIVVLGRGFRLREDRIRRAAALWHEGRSPLVFASGQGDAFEIIEGVEGLGVKSGCTAFEAMSATTEENAQFAAAMLLPVGVRSLILMTDPGHMLRAKLTFESFGFRVIEGMCDRVSAKGSGSVVLTRYVREYVGLVTYALRGRYQRRISKPVCSFELSQRRTMKGRQKKTTTYVKFL